MKLYLIHLPATAPSTDVLETLMIPLPPEAQARIKRFRLAEDGLRSLIGRLAPIWYLKKESLLPNDTPPTFGHASKGKPILIDPRVEPPISFNTSHEGAFVLLGIARGDGADVGVDLMEYPERPWDVQEGIYDQLTADERAVLALAGTEEQRRRLITRLWTFKEGFVKATGDGIGFGLERINVEMTIDDEVHGVQVDGRDIKLDGWSWSFGTIPPGSTGKEYGWTSFCKRDPDHHGEVQHIHWNDFVSVFLDDR